MGRQAERTAKRSSQDYLLFKGLQIIRDQGKAGLGIKIAIGAFSEAKRDVNIYGFGITQTVSSARQ
jgi:hypothetical protein